MQQALASAETLLRHYGHTYQANLAAIARTAFAEDPRAACHAINTDEWWGNRDSLAAIDLALDGGFTVESRRDAAALREALIEVFTTLRAYGEHHAAGEIVVSQFRKWRESHV